MWPHSGYREQTLTFTIWAPAPFILRRFIGAEHFEQLSNAWSAALSEAAVVPEVIFEDSESAVSGTSLDTLESPSPDFS